jgi:hypothetical protein
LKSHFNIQRLKRREKAICLGGNWRLVRHPLK